MRKAIPSRVIHYLKVGGVLDNLVHPPPLESKTPKVKHIGGVDLFPVSEDICGTLETVSR